MLQLISPSGTPRRSLIIIRLPTFVAIVGLVILSASCAARPLRLPQPMAQVCRDVVRVPSSVEASASDVAPLQWTEPADARSRGELAHWCATIGPAVAATTPRVPAAAAADGLAVVSWNVHVGGGDLRRLVRELRDAQRGHFVLLLQEVYRSGSRLPAISSALSVPTRIGQTAARSRDDIVRVAEELGLSLFYAPAMRNGLLGVAGAEEDRGNAILSTLPLSDLRVIELPLVRQRRIAVVATVKLPAAPWAVRVASTHLETRLPAGRTGQARALLAALPGDLPLVLGGDFNTLFGTAEQAYLELRAAFPATPSADMGRTFRSPLPLSLDHLFFRMPPGWTADVARGADHFGSDHYPIFGRLEMGTAPIPQN